MNVTIAQLMAEVGCSLYPERWNDLFDEAMAEYDRQGCFLANPVFYDQLHAKYGCFDRYGDIYKGAAIQTASDEMLGRFLTLLAMALQDKEHKKEDIKNFERPITPKGKTPLGYEMVTGLAMCSQLEGAADLLRTRGIPEEVIKRTLKMAVDAVSTYERKHEGAPGYELLKWAQHYIDGELFLIERLEIEFFSKFEGKAIVFKNGKGEVLTLANDFMLHRDGFALGSLYFEDEGGSWTANVEETEESWIGYPFREDGYVDKKKVVLSKAEWKQVLANGDPIIRLHIPPFGKMTPEMITQTIEATKEFASKYFSDFSYKAFACHSWLMDPQLDTLLGERTNIVKFSQRFHRLTYKSKGEAVFNFIFNKPDMNFDVKELPEDSSLQKALKNNYLSGKAIYELEGFFF